MPGGRPSSYTQDVGERICELVSEGVTTTKISKIPGMPSFPTIYRWEEDFPEFRSMFRRAKIVGTHYLANQSIDISDDDSGDLKTITNKKTGEEYEVMNAEFAARSRLRVDTRLRIIGMWNRKDYGDKRAVEVTGKDEGPLKTINSAMSAKEAAEAYADSLRGDQD